MVVGRGSVVEEGKMKNWKAGDEGCRLALTSYSSLLAGSLGSERVQGLRPRCLWLSCCLGAVCRLAWFVLCGMGALGCSTRVPG